MFKTTYAQNTLSWSSEALAGSPSPQDLCFADLITTTDISQNSGDTDPFNTFP